MATRGKRVRWLFGALTVAVAIAIGLSAGAFGSGASAAATKHGPLSLSAVTTHKVAPATALKKEVLEATYVESGESNTSLPAGTEVAMDNDNKIKCPAPAGKTCTITDAVSIQECYGADDADNWISAPWQVDGAYVGDGGPFFTSAPADGTCAGGTWTDADYGVASGTHHVQTFAYSVDGAYVEWFTITYNVYEP